MVFGNMVNVAQIRNSTPQVTVIAQEENQGYAFANNLGLRHVGFRDGAGVELVLARSLDEALAGHAVEFIEL
mgnify:CR=1 FL=1